MIEPSKFLPGTFIQYAWDATSLSALKTCPRLYYYTMIEGWQTHDESAHLRFGIEYHRALQDYDINLARGLGPVESLHEAISGLVARTADWKPDHKYKNRANLFRTVIWYLDHFKNDPAQTFIDSTGKPLVEASFRFSLDFGPSANRTWNYKDGDKPENWPDFTPYLLCGHLDRVVTFCDDLYVMDRKAQPISTSVLGQHGWIEIGHLQIGDLIAGKDGKFYPVKGLYPKGVTKVYEVTFNDRTSVRCASDHLWFVADQFGDHFKEISLQEMLTSLERKPYIKYHVPLVEPIQHPKANLPIDPYVLGALIGNGYLAGHSIELSSGDQDLISKVEERLGGNDIIKKSKGNNLTWIISGGHTLQGIRDLDLRVKSAHKHIPDEYLFASESQRLDLLQGLLDTDGSLNYGHQRYQSMSAQLIEDVSELVRSLGGTSRTTRRADGCYRASLRMPDWMSGVGRRYIVSIEEVESEESICIETTAPDHLYITEHYIVTHNTTTSSLGDYYYRQFSPNNQMTLYSLAAKLILNSPVRGVIIDAAEIKIDFSRFGRHGPIHHTPEQLSEWLDDLKVWLSMAESYAIAGHWPMNDTACDKFGGCRFREICSKSPGVRQKFLEANFVKGEPWNPLIPR